MFSIKFSLDYSAKGLLLLVNFIIILIRAYFNFFFSSSFRLGHTLTSFS